MKFTPNFEQEHEYRALRAHVRWAVANARERARWPDEQRDPVPACIAAKEALRRAKKKLRFPRAEIDEEQINVRARITAARRRAFQWDMHPRGKQIRRRTERVVVPVFPGGIEWPLPRGYSICSARFAIYGSRI